MYTCVDAYPCVGVCIPVVVCSSVLAFPGLARLIPGKAPRFFLEQGALAAAQTGGAVGTCWGMSLGHALAQACPFVCVWGALGGQ